MAIPVISAATMHIPLMSVYLNGCVEIRRRAPENSNNVASIKFFMTRPQTVRLAALYATLPKHVILIRPHTNITFRGSGNNLGEVPSDLQRLAEELLELGTRMLYSCDAVVRNYRRTH